MIGGRSAQSSYLGVRELEEHIPSSLDAKELARDPNDILVSPSCGLRRHRGAASDHTLELFGHVYICGRLFLNALNCGAFPSGNNWMQLVIDLNCLGMEACEFIKHDQQTDFGDARGGGGTGHDDVTHGFRFKRRGRSHAPAGAVGGNCSRERAGRS